MAEPVLAPRDVMAAGLCIGCGGCGPRAATLGLDRYGQLKPEGDWIAVPSAAFARTCPFSPAAANEDAIAAARFPDPAAADPRIGRFEQAYVGHVAEDGFRPDGSSGGLVTWVAAELLRRGLVDAVAHVGPRDPAAGGGFFGYRVSRDVAGVRAGAKSRYHPVELSGVLDEIRRVPGRYAIVGVPCFIKAVHLARAEEPVLAERIVFALGLFCGHMKSARLVNSFAWQLDAPADDVRAVEYRRKDAGRPANWYTAELTMADGSRRSRDWMHLADGDWGAGYFMNPACNYCDDVVAETADIAFGDAWVEPYASDGRGTNVAIVRSPVIADIVAAAVADGRLALDAVDADFIADTQAAGFRQRREGLAYRLRIAPPKLPLVKRVAAGAKALPWRRKLVYRMRRWIARDSHRVAALAKTLRWPGLYVAWARGMYRAYEGVTYRRGPVGRVVRWFDRAGSDAP